ncbi:hypothetical protein J2S05_002225 [Alkalicoccobacillus murimartini]|uniref:Uncharacterized protein n=1 Tax=Alkalicoccobacillus murimartini TaxID=171685 RepID=A0ABT9YHT6_9BACI|nr:hypothetical protein [Alkalicoccobacillus murimartini]
MNEQARQREIYKELEAVSKRVTHDAKTEYDLTRADVHD